MKQSNMIVIYKSSTGFTKKYAEMIANEMKCALEDYQKVSADMLSKYDIVIFGTRAHAGRIDGYQKAKKLFEKCNVGKLVLFVTGATPNAAADVLEAFWRQNLSEDEMTKLPHFYMQSGLCYEKMSLTDRLMMKVAAIMIKHKKNKTEQDIGFEEGIQRSFDNSSRVYIDPLISYMKADMKSIAGYRR
ncbi:MAG: flavodoxin domain-containing protein [Lachnospiraceae bacterium]|nr:flavodoxin domain-containing protein [Lachnospiraceae bacterium]